MAAIINVTAWSPIRIGVKPAKAGIQYAAAFQSYR